MRQVFSAKSTSFQNLTCETEKNAVYYFYIKNREVSYVFVYSNDLLSSRFNEYDLFFGQSGYVHTDESWHNSKVCSPFSRLYFVDGGKAKLHTENLNVIMEPGYVYLIPAGLTYDYEGLPSVDKLFFHLNLFRPDGYDLMLKFKDIGILPCSLDRMKHLYELYDSDRFSDTVLLKGYVWQTVAEIIDKYRIGMEDVRTYEPFIQSTMDYIRAHLSVKLTISEVADAMFVSVSTLTKAFKEQTGSTLGAYIDDLVMFSAERKLLRTNMSISEVSEKLGFCDQFYFSRYFKHRTGESPLQYRKRMHTVDFGTEPEITMVMLRNSEVEEKSGNGQKENKK